MFHVAETSGTAKAALESLTGALFFGDNGQWCADEALIGNEVAVGDRPSGVV